MTAKVGAVNVYIPRGADGELLTGAVPKGMRARAKFTRSVDVRTFFDALADRNLSNAIRTVPKAKAYNPNVAPKGWRLRPVETSVPEPIPAIEVEAPLCCRHCGRHDFRTPAGMAWHVERCTVTVAA